MVCGKTQMCKLKFPSLIVSYWDEQKSNFTKRKIQEELSLKVGAVEMSKAPRISNLVFARPNY
jgi:hypothetical protein